MRQGIPTASPFILAPSIQRASLIELSPGVFKSIPGMIGKTTDSVEDFDRV